MLGGEKSIGKWLILLDRSGGFDKRSCHEIKLKNQKDITMQILNRADAAERNVLRYYTGIPCRRGHLSERYVSSGNCVMCLHPKAPPKPPSVRDLARVRGALYFDPDVPCPRGHMTPRYVSTGGCIECLNNPRNGYGQVLIKGSLSTLEQTLEYHAYLVSQEPSPLTVEHMTPGPRLAEINMQRHLKRRKLIP